MIEASIRSKVMMNKTASSNIITISESVVSVYLVHHVHSKGYF